MDRDSQSAERRVVALLQALHTERPHATDAARPRFNHPREASRHVETINAFFEQTLAPYLNYHRLYSFSSERVGGGCPVRC